MPLNPEFKSLVISALRGGKYPQGNCWLQKDNKFCCLGVIAELAKIEKRRRNRNEDEGYVDDVIEYKIPNKTGSNWTAGEIPKSLCGLNHDQCNTLANMNDADKSFEEIAEFLEQNQEY